MEPQKYRELRGWTVDQVADRLKATGDPKVARVNGSLVSKHERGKCFPRPEFIERYAELSEGAVTAEDWMRLRQNPPPPMRLRKVAAA